MSALNPNGSLFIGGRDITFNVGVSYIAIGVIFIPLHIICSYLIYTDKEMQNPTYRMMINLSIADVGELSAIAVYAGTVLVTQRQSDYEDRVMGLVLLICWYVNDVLFPMIAFSRWIALTRSHMVTHVFRPKIMRAMQLLPWIVSLLLCIHPTIIAKKFAFIPPVFTWGFDPFTEYGHFLHWNNTVFTAICAGVEIVFNVMSLKAVHKTRKSIQSVSTIENRKREVKLLIQCSILGMVFLLTDILYTTVATTGIVAPAALLTVQYTWTTNHCVNPLVYLTVNTKLRRRFLDIITCVKYDPSKQTNKVAHTRATRNAANARSVTQRQ